jgi:hypothetical protein
MIVNGVVKKSLTRASIALQEKISVYGILLYGSDNNIETAPLILVYLLVRLVPPILFYGGIVIQFVANQRIEPITLLIVNRDRQRVLGESLPLLD